MDLTTISGQIPFSLVPTNPCTRNKKQKTEVLVYMTTGKSMQVQDVIKSLIASYKIGSDGIINLLGISKKRKEEALRLAYREYMLYGKQAVVLLSVCTSSSLFAWILRHSPQVCYWKNRVSYLGKRYNLIILYFCHPRKALLPKD